MAAVGEITSVGALPPGVAPPKTARDVALFAAAKQFEGVFVKQLVDDMLKGARGNDDASGDSQIYQSMADETMTKNLVDSGSFGLAGTLYAFVKRGEGSS